MRPTITTLFNMHSAPKPHPDLPICIIRLYFYHTCYILTNCPNVIYLCVFMYCFSLDPTNVNFLRTGILFLSFLFINESQVPRTMPSIYWVYNKYIMNEMNSKQSDVQRRK